MRRRELLVAGGAAAFLGAIGCRSAVQTGPAASSGPQRGGIAVVAQTADLTPRTVFAVNVRMTSNVRLVYNTLTELDHTTLEPQPSLATSWAYSDNGTTLRMQLRDDVKFHSGRPFGPADVIYAIQQLQLPERGNQFRATASAIVDMAASGANEVTLRLRNPINTLFDMFEVMFITDRESLAGLLEGSAFVGTGPFRFVSWTPGQSFITERNPEYWKPERPYLDGVEMRVIPQVQALLASLQTQQTHLGTSDLAPKDVVALRNTPGFEAIQNDTYTTSYYVGCNLNVPPFDRKEIRQAVGYAIDRQSIATQVFSDLAFPQSVPWSRPSPAYNEAQANHYKHDPERARRMLAQAGITGGTWPLGVANMPATLAMAQVIQFNLQQIGITANIQAEEPAAFFQKLGQGTLPGLWANVRNFGNLHPSTLVTAAFPYNAARNSSNFSDPAYTALANKIWTSNNQAELKAGYEDITDLLLDQAFVLELASYPITHVSSKLKDYRTNMFDYLIFDDAYLT